jgi:hypothetical protein
MEEMVLKISVVVMAGFFVHKSMRNKFTSFRQTYFLWNSSIIIFFSLDVILTEVFSGLDFNQN